MVRDSAREFLEREAWPDVARESGSEGADFWAKVSDMGWPGLAVAEQHGGAERGMNALGFLLEQRGAYLPPGPLFGVHCSCGANPVEHSG